MFFAYTRGLVAKTILNCKNRTSIAVDREEVLTFSWHVLYNIHNKYK